MAGCRKIIGLIFITALLCAAGCRHKVLNDPHASDRAQGTDNTFYTVFSDQPKTLDPAKSYSSNENVFTAQIYEPPLQYHYLLRPYQLIPLTATAVPAPCYEDQQHRPVAANASNIAYTVYTLHIKPGIFYQPHPAFAKKQGHYSNLSLSKTDLKHIHTLANFKQQGTRELTADDYVYEIKRLASPRVQSPIAGFLSSYILGMKAYMQQLQQAAEKQPAESFFDLRPYSLAGVRLIDRYTFQITIMGKYPQFVYWLAMPFFAPVPWEADAFYSQPGMKDKNITLDWFPVGTGPYQMIENNPNAQIVLEKNPNFHDEYYPTEGMPTDKAAGFLKNAGKKLPLVDRAVFTLEKESIPHWNKFLQGYYDRSGISADSYDQAIRVTENGQLEVSQQFQDRGIYLNTSTDPGLYYLGFNMLDPVVGGYTKRAQALRQAISIALDTEEYISIFLNGRGVSAQGPIPQGIFGYRAGEAGINPVVYQWRGHHEQRRSLADAKRLLVEAGYPEGREATTGKPLLLNYDAVSTGSPDERAMVEWMRKQFAKLGIQLYVRATQYNRFQEKMRTGNAQVFFWGWTADYPDPENFLFLLYGPNSKVKQGGENAANYENSDYDALFVKMKNMENSPERQKIIDQMVTIARKDAPWMWGFNPKTFMLSHQWVSPTKPSIFGNNTLKYLQVDPALRQRLQQSWNQPIFWPLWLLLVILFVLLLPVILRYRKKQHSPPKRY